MGIFFLLHRLQWSGSHQLVEILISDWVLLIGKGYKIANKQIIIKITTTSNLCIC